MFPVYSAGVKYARCKLSRAIVTRACDMRHSGRLEPGAWGRARSPLDIAASVSLLIMLKF